MNANDLKPWIFWIVCGVLAVAIVVTALVMEPTDAKGKGAAALKKDADSQLKDLSDLKRRGANNPYIRTFDPENPKDIESLTNDYLIPERWGMVLKPHVEGYDVQTQQIRSHLAERSVWLRSPVSTTSDNFDWYKEYERQTAALLRKVAEAGSLVVAANTDLAEDAGIRTAMGLFTKSGEFVRQQGEREALSRTYRHVELLLERVAEARGRIIENPVVQAVAGDVPQNTMPARISRIDLGEADEPLGGQMTGLGTARRATLRIEGPLAALQAVVARLESNERADRPLIVVGGLDLRPIGSGKPGDHRDRPSEDLAMDIRLAVLDFAQLAAPVATPGAAPEAQP
ncbi:MAG: hypothetical protein RLZZ127_1191 [Planctomycetota bacterium]